MDELTNTTGIVALAACVVAGLALLLGAALAVRLARLRRDQRLLLGGDGEHDLVAHAAGLEREYRALHDYVEDAVGRMSARLETVEVRLDDAFAFRSLVRYDAYGEMSGRQSVSIALLDASRSGFVLSSIHHRDQARIYAKRLHDGESESELSPEEAEAVELALRGKDAAAA